MNSRRIAPIIRPISTSLITAPATPLTWAGMGGIPPLTTGMIARAMAKAKARRMRGGMKVSPMPGISMTIAASRAKTRPPANTCWAVA